MKENMKEKNIEEKKKGNKSKKIEFRVSEEELKRIDRIAKRKNMNRSEYILSCISMSYTGKKAEVKVVYALTRLQELLNGDIWDREYLKEEMDEIWNSLLK